MLGSEAITRKIRVTRYFCPESPPYSLPSKASRLGLPVPPGFTITADVTESFFAHRGLPGSVRQEILEGLSQGHTQLRLVAVRSQTGALLLDDTYNASPESMLAALNLLDELDGRKVAVLGEMLELGPYERSGHELVGLRTAQVANMLVTLGPRAGDEFAVLSGLKAGEKVVTSANFLVDSESQLQAALGAFAPPPPGAGAAAAMNQTSAPKGELEFSTSPSPPSKGNNTFRAKLTGNGVPISGAEVTVTFFMPAMPAMGMAAMRTVVKLDDHGGGTYQGMGVLQSGGTWQVTIVARKNSQTLVTKQFSMNAEGGM